MEFFHEIVALKTRMAELEAAVTKLENALSEQGPIAPPPPSDEELAWHAAQAEKEIEGHGH